MRNIIKELLDERAIDRDHLRMLYDTNLAYVHQIVIAQNDRIKQIEDVTKIFVDQ